MYEYIYRESASTRGHELVMHDELIKLLSGFDLIEIYMGPGRVITHELLKKVSSVVCSPYGRLSIQFWNWIVIIFHDRLPTSLGAYTSIHLKFGVNLALLAIAFSLASFTRSQQVENEHCCSFLEVEYDFSWFLQFKFSTEQAGVYWSRSFLVLQSTTCGLYAPCKSIYIVPAVIALHNCRDTIGHHAYLTAFDVFVIAHLLGTTMTVFFIKNSDIQLICFDFTWALRLFRAQLTEKNPASAPQILISPLTYWALCKQVPLRSFYK